MQNGATLECPKCFNLLTCYIGSPTRCACGEVIQLQLQMAAEKQREGTSDTTPTYAAAALPSHPVPTKAIRKATQPRVAPVASTKHVKVPGRRDNRIMNTGRWTKDEHDAFVRGLDLYGREWKKVANLIPSRTVVQIRTHAQKYFQKLQKEQGQDHSKDDTKRGRPKKKPSRSGETSRSGRPSKKQRQLSYTGRSDHPIGGGASGVWAVPNAVQRLQPAGVGQPPTPRTMRAAVTLVDQRTTARLQAGKNTPRTRAAAEWLAGLHAEGKYSWSAAAHAGSAAARAVKVKAKAKAKGKGKGKGKGIGSASMPSHPAHPIPFHPQYSDKPSASPPRQMSSSTTAPRMALLASNNSASGAGASPAAKPGAKPGVKPGVKPDAPQRGGAGSSPAVAAAKMAMRHTKASRPSGGGAATGAGAATTNGNAAAGSASNGGAKAGGGGGVQVGGANGVQAARSGGAEAGSGNSNGSGGSAGTGSGGGGSGTLSGNRDGNGNGVRHASTALQSMPATSAPRANPVLLPSSSSGGGVIPPASQLQQQQPQQQAPRTVPVASSPNLAATSQLS